MTTAARPILAEYCRAGWVLVPIPHGRKGPTTPRWNQRDACVAEPEVAQWLEGNVGLAHAYSGTCAVDVDDLDGAIAWLQARGIDLRAMLDAPDAVRIESRPGRAKLLYRTTPLPSFKLGPLELRCASSTGTTLQDVLPPSVHPDTGKPYEWRFNTPDAHWSKLPPLPAHIAALWASLGSSRPVGTAAAPVKQKPAGKLADTLAELRAELAGLSADMPYDSWVAVGMAIHYETRAHAHGLALWNEWSANGAKYKGIGDLETHWRSFRLDHEAPATLASLRRASVALPDEFPDVTAEATKPAPIRAPARPAVLDAARSADRAAEILRVMRRTKLGTFEARISNIVAILGIPELCGWRLAMDEYLGAVVLAPAGSEDWRPFTDVDYTNLRVWLETTGNCEPISHEMMRQAVHLAADNVRMDSAQEWLGKLQWDGRERVPGFCHEYLGTPNDEYSYAVSCYLWTALAGRIMEPGCQADMVPVIIGSQGVGKSRGVQAMAPSLAQYAELRLDEPDDTIARKMRGVVVAEFAEMRGLRAADLERAKALVTRTHERWVPKYQEFAIDYPRRFVIVGTTNDDEFLPLDTEQRRWLPVHTRGVDVKAIHRDREQLWAEAASRWITDGIFWHGLDGLAMHARESAQGEDVWEYALRQWLADVRGPVRLQDALTQGVGLDYRTVNRTAEFRAARILRRLGYVKRVIREGSRTARVWLLDPDSQG